MSIEFFCEHCYQKVETPESTAGKKGRCPHCSEIMRIPKSSTAEKTQSGGPKGINTPRASQRPQVPAPIPQVPTPLNPAAAPAPEPAHATQQSNWGQTGQTTLQQREAARRKANSLLAAPVTLLTVVSIINIVVSIGVAIIMLFYFGWSYNNGTPDYFRFVTTMIYAVLNVGTGTLVTIGANHAKLTKSYTMAIGGCVLAVLPVSGCCVFTAPLAIWVLAILFRADVKSAFKQL